jgi:hypothetical protein
MRTVPIWSLINQLLSQRIIQFKHWLICLNGVKCPKTAKRWHFRVSNPRQPTSKWECEG